MEKFIYLVPFDNIDKDILDFLSANLPKIIPFPVKTYFNLPIPSNTYNPERNQYLSLPFLDILTKLKIPDSFKVLGITNVDLYTHGLNFIFGQAKLNGKEALVSIARLDNSFYRLPKNHEILYIRTLKESVHELGHTLGLSHCPNPECVMHFSNSISDTDRKSYNFCPICKLSLSYLF
uniref:Archaemetzincin n=1 Tax=Dictyoglomus thermophilum TaxID=14 RepID=A0A7C3RNB0_DICTH